MSIHPNNDICHLPVEYLFKKSAIVQFVDSKLKTKTNFHSYTISSRKRLKILIFNYSLTEADEIWVSKSLECLRMRRYEWSVLGCAYLNEMISLLQPETSHSLILMHLKNSCLMFMDNWNLMLFRLSGWWSSRITVDDYEKLKNVHFVNMKPLKLKLHKRLIFPYFLLLFRTLFLDRYRPNSSAEIQRRLVGD